MRYFFERLDILVLFSQVQVVREVHEFRTIVIQLSLVTYLQCHPLIIIPPISPHVVIMPPHRCHLSFPVRVALKLPS